MRTIILNDTHKDLWVHQSAIEESCGAIHDCGGILERWTSIAYLHHNPTVQANWALIQTLTDDR